MDEEQTLAAALEAEFDKQSEEVSEQVETEAPEVEAQESEESEVETEESEKEVSPPEHWSEEDQQAFMALDDSGREWALRLEKNAHKGIEEKSLELKKFRDAFEPYRNLVPEGNETQTIQQLLNAQTVLQRNPLEGIKWLMRSYGVDEKQFQTDTPDDDVYIDPQVKALQDQVKEMKTQGEQNLRNAEIQRQNAMLAEIQSFQNETDEQGNALHPHFNAVQGVMSGLLGSGRATDMEDAYQQAVWAVPEYREAEVDRKAKEHAEAQLKAKNDEAAKAAKAGTEVKGKKSAKTKPKKITVRDDLAANYEKSIRGEL